MSLAPGTRLGPYEITAQIGAGGMGEVYRATDTNLKRQVAIKVLPHAVAADAERLARFQREAEVLASLSHPNIAIIHGLEKSDGVTGLVMELVEGPTLAERIAQGPISVGEALPIAKQIAEALEAAHEQGIIHRDLKSANVKVRPDGTVKVLDFGLAKVIESTSSMSAAVHSMSPTITTPAMTQAGLILGTAAYMSPEQAKGRAADKRSDIWAFGCVLYEMLTGNRAFAADDVADTLAFVLTREPDLAALPASSPLPIRRLLRRCLEKDRRRRLADIADARFELEDALAHLSDRSLGTTPRRSSRISRDMAVAVSAFLLGVTSVGLWWWTTRATGAALPVARFAIPLSAGERFGESGARVLAISRDGANVAFVVGNRLHLRSIATSDARPIDGTEHQTGQVRSPVFSPDGESIAFVSSVPARIKRVAVQGGAAVTICEGCGPLGAMSWDDRGIVFAQGGQGLPFGFAGERATGTARIMRLSPEGGEPEVLFEVTDGVPWDVQMLPDGEHVMFGLIADVANMVGGVSEDEARVVVRSIRTGHQRTIVANAMSAKYVSSGHLLYVRQGVLFARRFDLDRLEATGREAPVVEGVGRASFVGSSTMAAYYDASDSGSLAYVPGPVSTEIRFDLGVLDPRSGMKPMNLPPGGYEFPRVSPKGGLIAVDANDGRTAHIWLFDRSGANAFRQLTFVGKNRFPVWSANGDFLTFQSDREGDLALFRQRADGTGNAERLTKPDAGTAHIPAAWTPDDGTLLFEAVNDSERTLWARTADGAVRRFSEVVIAQAIGGPIDAVISPNGRWVAYKTVAGSGANRGPVIMVEPAPPDGTKHLIGNGLHPAWSRDGKTLFFRRLTTGEFLATRILSEVPFAFETPQRLPVTFAHRQSNSSSRSYDVTPEGSFVGVVPAGGTAAERAVQVNVVLNWQEELKRIVPTN